MNTPLSNKQLFEALSRIEKLAILSDSKFRIPFTRIRFGLDSVIGLIPIVGDTVSLLFSLYLMYEASKLGTPTLLKLRMLGNVVFDWLIGLIPFLGDLFDIAFKGNKRNMKLLVEHIDKEYRSRQMVVLQEEDDDNPGLMLFVIIALMLSLSLYAVTHYF